MWVGGQIGIGGALDGIDGFLQLLEGFVVFEIAANVGGGALMELTFGGFHGLFEGAALGQFGGGDVAYQAGVDGAVFAGGQDRSQRLIKLVIGRLRRGVHFGCGYWIAEGGTGGWRRLGIGQLTG